VAVQNLSESVLYVDLPTKEPYIVEELKKVNEIISENDNTDVVVDFSKVELIISSTISNLLILQEYLNGYGRKLIFCAVSLPTRCIFTVAGLAEYFTFVDDKFAALEDLRQMNQVNS